MLYEGFDECVSLTLLSAIFKLFWGFCQKSGFSHCIRTGCIISPKCVLESHDNCIFWNVLVCICISVHYFWLFLFLFRMCVGLQWSLSSRARRRHQTPRRVINFPIIPQSFPVCCIMSSSELRKLFKC